MRIAASIGIGLLVSFLTLWWATDHLDTISRAACSDTFTLPALACRFGGLGVTLLLGPTLGVVAFVAARRLLPR
jgi:hypothetical protein